MTISLVGYAYRVQVVAYEYDIFLSYKRHPEARQWLVEHLQPLLEFHVELLSSLAGSHSLVFRDDQDIETGDTWPAHLGRALGNSRVLVALRTRTYFHSEWCSREQSTMLAREQDEGLRTAERPEGVMSYTSIGSLPVASETGYPHEQPTHSPQTVLGRTAGAWLHATKADAASGAADRHTDGR